MADEQEPGGGAKPKSSVEVRWLQMRKCLVALKPCRVPIILVLAGLAFLLVGQGEDILRGLAEKRTPATYWQPYFFFAASLAWSFSAWYWARQMLLVKLPGIPEPQAGLDRLRAWTPRALGFLATLGIAVTFYMASRGYGDDEREVQQVLWLQWYAAWWLVYAVAFLLFVSLRRRVLKLPELAKEGYGTRELKDLPRSTRRLLRAALAASALLFILMTWFVQWAAPWFGSAAIVLFAAAAWISIASRIDLFGMQKRFPVFTALLVLAVASSFFNDNHEVRTLADAEQPKARRNLRDNLEAWIGGHQAAIDRGETIPLFVVSAEGGGIRAAYWAATVLGKIQDRHPRFSDHVFSLSGVSGGSLGVGVFLALVAERQREGAAPFFVAEKAQAVLGEDFLSPVVASLLFPDLVQRFIPFPIPSFDRARTLEQSWEKAWSSHVAGRNRMSEPFDNLWTTPERWMPALLFNATWVETGKRIIASNMNVNDTNQDFIDVEDAHAFFSPRALSLSTAAHMSARFTYVSPAGALVKDGRMHGHVVDGGYFENSGATASLAILQTIGLLRDKGDERWDSVELYAIHIRNDPVDPRYADDSLLNAPDTRDIRPVRFFGEVLSPLWALVNTRGARGFYARESVDWFDPGNFFEIGLCRGSQSVPLGWVLSKNAQSLMEDQLTTPGYKCAAAFDNYEQLKQIGDRLPRPAPKGGPAPAGELSPARLTPGLRKQQ